MEQKERLIERLKEYGRSQAYPFHMPGHKRLKGLSGEFGEFGFPNPFLADITEIDGFDNLHHAQGILKESMDWAAKVYGADRSFYLVNGSSGGILAAVGSVMGYGETLLMSRNCHKAAYHSAYLNGLKASYVYPQQIPGLGIQGGILPEDVEKALEEDRSIRAVLVVSPTYDGILSDIGRIARIVHRFGLPLIVDEAHGAHLRYIEEFPASALDMGADLVIQSVHKTLPSLTQTAILHMRRNEGEGGPFVDEKRLERMLQIYQSSSPSYVFMASIENAIFWMEGQRKERGQAGNRIDWYAGRLKDLRQRFCGMKGLRLAGEGLEGKFGVLGIDPSKIVVSAGRTGADGAGLDDMLRQRFGLEMEMCGAGYVTAITSVLDSEEGLSRLEEAFLTLDRELSGEPLKVGDVYHEMPYPVIRRRISEAMDQDLEQVRLEESLGRVSAEFIYIYPPGIPIAAPGEEITGQVLALVKEYLGRGLPVQGMDDPGAEYLKVIKEG